MCAWSSIVEGSVGEACSHYEHDGGCAHGQALWWGPSGDVCRQCEHKCGCVHDLALPWVLRTRSADNMNMTVAVCMAKHCGAD